MKTAIILAALLASTAAQAQSIVSIGREDGYIVSLIDMPCPQPGWRKVAIFINYGPEGGRAVGCWRPAKRVTQIELDWTDVRTKREPPDIMPVAVFENVEN